MKNIYIASDNIISPIGLNTAENMAALKTGRTGIMLHEDEKLYPVPFWASTLDEEEFSERYADFCNFEAFTRFERLVICSIKEALAKCDVDISSNKTLVILSTTKGNVELLDLRSSKKFDADRIYLWKTAEVLQQYFGLKHIPLVVSNACISGVLASIIAGRYIHAQQFDNVVVAGADMVTEFVLSGFNSFLSLCQGPCKPFDKDRQGLSLGEAAGTIIYTAIPALADSSGSVLMGTGYSSNDANHISGPSRTGEGLTIAIKKTLTQLGGSIDYISAHGTATPYNDEMESIAITRSGLNHVPVNSLKGYWGHTLGAAGVIESIACIHAVRYGVLYNTLGFSTSGVSHPIAVIDKNMEIPVQSCLKIASGFGGSNASLIFHQ